MINLETIREKLENILNGTDTETSDFISQVNEKYFFNVATQGYDLKSIFDMQSGKNFIPVFVSSVGGTYNPIPDLKERSLSIQVDIYFPVRFKDDFYTYLTEFLEDVFVGKMLTYGTKKALHNISVPQYGEIDTFAVKQFKDFITNTYKMPFEVSEQWMNMSLTIYISTLADGFAFGNEATTIMTYVDSEDEIVSLAHPVFTTQTADANVETQSEQILGETQAKSLGVVSGYAFTIDLYIQDNNFFRHLLNDHYRGKIQNNRLTLATNFMGMSFLANCIISTANVNITKGQALKISLQVVRKK